jgi:hypothetical protein
LQSRESIECKCVTCDEDQEVHRDKEQPKKPFGVLAIGRRHDGVSDLKVDAQEVVSDPDPEDETAKEGWQ